MALQNARMLTLQSYVRAGFVPWPFEITTFIDISRQVPSHILCLYGKRFKHVSRTLSGYCAAAGVDVAEVQGPVTRLEHLSIELRTVGEHAKPCADSLRAGASAFESAFFCTSSYAGSACSTGHGRYACFVFPQTGFDCDV